MLKVDHLVTHRSCQLARDRERCAVKIPAAELSGIFGMTVENSV